MSYRIPFPTNFISLNTPTKKADNVAVSALEVDTTHTFLSNRPTARHSSFSSESSTGSISATSPSTQAVESPTMKASVPNFLTLNSKFEAPPTSPKNAGVEKTGFLSNRA